MYTCIIGETTSDLDLLHWGTGVMVSEQLRQNCSIHFGLRREITGQVGTKPLRNPSESRSFATLGSGNFIRVT